MEKKDLRIIFMGTPEFAVGTLSRLVEGGYNVVAVATSLWGGIKTSFRPQRLSNTLSPTPYPCFNR